ncbi:unnamed protein product, partial [Phaeothamnion confervicola]
MPGPSESALSRGRGGRRGRRRKGAVRRAEAGEEDDNLCLVCANPLEHYSVGQCNHAQVCSLCTLRQRVLLKDRSCVICKTELERVIVAKREAEARTFDSFNLWNDTAGPDSAFDAASGTIYVSCLGHFRDMAELSAMCCPIEGCDGTDRHTEIRGEGGGDGSRAPALCKHMRVHQRHICLLCLENRPQFVKEQQLFTSAALRKHETELGGHPLCRFCDRR